MKTERCKPIPVESPHDSRLKFVVRTFFDLQLKTIDSRLSSLLSTLAGKLLDIGAGQSPWRGYLKESTSYQGVDIQSADEFGMTRHKDIVYYDGSILPFPENQFDSAICIEVLEHSTDPQLLLCEAFRVLKPGAPFILSVPWSARVHHIPYDFHRFTPYQLDRMLTKAGFVNIDIQGRGNDVCVVANKLIIIGWRLLSPVRRIYLTWTLPLAVLELTLAFVLLISAHASLLLKLGSDEDPLGYFVKCKKA